MSWLAEYGQFIAQLITVIIVISIAPIMIIANMGKGKADDTEGTLVCRLLNTTFEKDRVAITDSLLQDDKSSRKAEQKRRKSVKNQYRQKALCIVLDFTGDIKATSGGTLGRCVSAILILPEVVSEVVIRLESSGGMVHAYGYAAAQIERLRDAGIKTTICVDKIAASGGYMMAVVAHTIVASPYAIVGSIGVIAQLPNFHRFLQKHAIDFEQITAGEYKRKLTMFGENTQQGRDKLTAEIAEIHQLFKQFVIKYRPQLDIEQVANGDTWFGIEAIDKALIDRIATSETYLLERSQQYNLLHIDVKRKKTLTEKFFQSTASGVERASVALMGYIQDQSQKK